MLGPGMGRWRKDARGRFARGQAINPAALRQARQAAGLTLTEAAAGIVSRQALHQFEAGRARPRREILEALAQRVLAPVDTLLARPHDPRERALRDLEQRRQWAELERLAQQVLADANVTARTQAVARLYLGRAMLDPAPEEALFVLRLAGGQLAQLGERRLAAEARDWEGAALYYLQDPSAIEVGRDALSRYRMLEDRDPGVEARMLEHIGSYLLQRQEVSEALRCYHRAIEVAGKVLDWARLANIYHGLASGCSRIGETRQALEYFDRAVLLSRIHHDVQNSVSASLPRLENDYGECLLRLGRWERAEEMISAALEHFAAAGIEAAKAHALLSMGDLKHRQGQLEDALRWTDEAIALAERLGETVSLAAGYQQLGELRAGQGDEERCEACFARAVEILANAGLGERRAQALQRYRRVRDGAVEHQQGS
jgi:tetratricopeptide (TPR) repeat protein